MVVVSINHRLNVLGYLDVSSISPKYANSANAGTEDMVAALAGFGIISGILAVIPTM